MSSCLTFRRVTISLTTREVHDSGHWVRTRFWSATSSAAESLRTLSESLADRDWSESGTGLGWNPGEEGSRSERGRGAVLGRSIGAGAPGAGDLRSRDMVVEEGDDGLEPDEEGEDDDDEEEEEEEEEERRRLIPRGPKIKALESGCDGSWKVACDLWRGRDWTTRDRTDRRGLLPRGEERFIDVEVGAEGIERRGTVVAVVAAEEVVVVVVGLEVEEEEEVLEGDFLLYLRVDLRLMLERTSGWPRTK